MPAIEMIESVQTLELEPAPAHLPAVAASPFSQQDQQQASDPTVQLLATAVSRGASMDELRELLQLRRELREDQERERQLAAKLAFNRDFAAFKALNIVVPKTKAVQQRGREGKQGPSYMQSEFHVVAQLLQPALSSLGFGYRFDVKFERGDADQGPWCKVLCRLEHRDGHTEELLLEGPPDDSGQKNSLQEMQSSATFLMRHALLAITGTAQSGSDNDGRGLRGYRQDGEDQGQEVTSEEERLHRDGTTAADAGLKALTAWWGSLTDKQRSLMNPHFGGMRKRAEKAGGAR